MGSCQQVNATSPHWWLVNVGSRNSLVLSGSKPLPEPMLTPSHVAIWCDQASMCFNSSPLSVRYRRQWTGSALVQVMACRLFGTKSPEPRDGFLSIGLLETNFSEIWIGSTSFSFKENAFENVVCQTDDHFVLRKNPPVAAARPT